MVAPGFRRDASSVKLDRFTGCHYLWGYPWDLALLHCVSYFRAYFIRVISSYFELFRVSFNFRFSDASSRFECRFECRFDCHFDCHFESLSRFVRTRRPATPWSRCTRNSRPCDNTTWLSSKRSWRRTGGSDSRSGTRSLSPQRNNIRNNDAGTQKHIEHMENITWIDMEDT